MKYKYFKLVISTLTIALFNWSCIAENKEVLPLEIGMYVRSTVKCEDASNADILSYNGNGINSAHIVCEIKNAKKHGNTFNLTEKCEGDGGMGGNAKFTQRSTIKITGRVLFSLSNEYVKSEEYRYCGNPNHI